MKISPDEDVKIVIAGGKQKADFLINMLLDKGFEPVVINEDSAQCEYLAKKYRIPVIWGNPAKLYTLYDANIEGSDIMIALHYGDADNLAICQAAEKLFGIKKTVAVVSNPKNVEVFRKLGVKTVISATYTVSNIIEQASIVGNIVNTLPIEDDKVVITRLLIDENSPVIGMQIKDIPLPENVIISCIIRQTGITVPNGQTVITKDDKLMIISDPSLQRKVLEIMTGSRKKSEA
ncbi:MAG: TrkA family potassium uptake protein [Clostridiales bacterium]|jgi:trk system potassium uptake protein TrkA|nr:TrkA family potassium uptake protein [Clostridiales bacterium]